MLEVESSLCIVLQCTKHFVVILPSSQYDLNNVERDVNPSPAEPGYTLPLQTV